MTLKHVWKFSIPPDRAKKSSIKIPRGGRILSAQAQRGDVCLWALVDPAASLVERAVRVIGTGWDVTEDPGDYVGTVQLGGGALVFHVFVEEEAA